MSATVLSVSQVNLFLRSLIDGDGRLADILVVGELSNFTVNSRSGHMYFSLKDAKSLLRGVMFASAARRLRFRPEDGMRVIVRGRVSVYEPNGQYQLYAEDIQPDGVGALALAYEQLKQRLAAEGLFDQSRKRPLPPYPARIGVVTSPTGAALQDMLQIMGKRWPVAEVVLCPAQVQGEQAPAQLIAGLRELNRRQACDVIIIGRGGGSTEELWAFNDEELARAVAASEIPVVSAVGHETDFTVCDLAADLRAPTPSAAAVLCTPDREALAEDLLSYHRWFRSRGLQLVDSLRQRVDMLVQNSPLCRREEYVLRRRAQLDGLWARLCSLTEGQAQAGRRNLAVLAGKLDALSPLKVLSRGYGIIYHQGAAVRDLDALPEGAEVVLQAEKGKRTARLVPQEETEKQTGNGKDFDYAREETEI